MTLTYQNNPIKKIADINAGKNSKNSKAKEYSGIYTCDQTSQNPEKDYFVKLVEDKRELFAEFFAGCLLDELKKVELIPKEYQDCFICADLIKLPTGQYAIIQPYKKFFVAHQITQTGDKDDRWPFYEYLFLDNKINRLIEVPEQYSGLSYILFLNLLFSNYSVHTGNIVLFKDRKFGSIDNGAMFRDLGADENNQNILKSKESRSVLTSYKNYPSHFRKIKGLYHKVYEKSVNFNNKITQKPSSLSTAIQNALNRIPKDLLDENDKQSIAKYIGIQAFETITFKKGRAENTGEFKKQFVKIIQNRLNLFTKLKSEHYHSQTSKKPFNLYLSVNPDELNKEKSHEELELEKQDLKQLKTFKDKAIQYITSEIKDKDAQAKHIQKVVNFYDEACFIRKSNMPIKHQKETIKKKAEETFKHRDYIPRVFADILMILGFLFGGFGVMIYRKSHDKPLFFSNSPTNRQKMLEEQLNSDENAKSVFKSTDLNE